MIYKRKPKQFQPKFEVVSCFCEFNGKFVLLLRQDHKDRGNLWGVPAGKIDLGESPIQAIQREIREETGISCTLSDLKHFKRIFVRYPDFDFVYHIFYTKLDDEKKIQINQKEHKEYIWVSPEKALTMNLITDEDKCIRLFYKHV